ncbi:MAG: hypothetical protein RLZZ501_2282 [Pseudomonadota bacterium]
MNRTVLAGLFGLALALAAPPAWAEAVPGADNGRYPVGRYPSGLDTSRAMVIDGSVQVAAPPRAVAAFLARLDRHFLALNPDNRKTEVIGGGDLVPGAEWITEQIADGQLVRSRHKVVEADGVSRMTLVSDPSVTLVDDEEHVNPTITHFTITARTDGGSVLRERLTICFSSRFERIGAELIGVDSAWENRTKAGLAEMARRIEAEQAATPAASRF